PLVTINPPASASRNFAGNVNRPLSSSRGVCVPRNTATHLPASGGPAMGHPCAPRSPTLPHFSPLSTARHPPCRLRTVVDAVQNRWLEVGGNSPHKSLGTPQRADREQIGTCSTPA